MEEDYSSTARKVVALYYQTHCYWYSEGKPVVTGKTMAAFNRVVYHGVTSSFFGIGILPVSDLPGGQYFRSVLLIWRELLFSAKGGLAVSKRGPVPPFSSKRGPVPPF
jgi:hypothetical protein